MSSSTYIIPPELLDKILGHHFFSSDNPNPGLTACLHGSRTLRAIAQDYIFRDITLTYNLGYDEGPKRGVVFWEDNEETSGVKFSNLLHASPQITSCIRSLTLHFPSRKNVEGSRSATTSSSSEFSLWSITSQLHKLEKLSFPHVGDEILWHWLEEGTQQFILDMIELKTITKLNICAFTAVCESLLRKCHTAKELAVRFHDMYPPFKNEVSGSGQDQGRSDSEIPRKIQLNSLEIQRCAFTALLFLDLRNLTSLKFSARWTCQYPKTIETILALCKETLKDLEIEISLYQNLHPSPPISVPMDNKLDFSSHSKLREVTVSISPNSHPDGFNLPITDPTLLKSIAMTSGILDSLPVHAEHSKPISVTLIPPFLRLSPGVDPVIIDQWAYLLVYPLIYKARGGKVKFSVQTSLNRNRRAEILWTSNVTIGEYDWKSGILGKYEKYGLLQFA